MKKIFTLMAVALVAMTASAQEKVLFEDGVEYGNGATLTSENTTLVLGNDRATKGYDMKHSSCKAYCAELFGQTVMEENSSGELEPKTRVVYAVGANNPKDGELDESDKSTGASFDPATGNLPLSGTYYMITPQKAGHINAFIILNADKAIFVVKASTSECLPLSELTLKGDGDNPVSRQFKTDEEGNVTNMVADKLTGTLEFDVEAGETYYVFCNGSKLSFGGYVFTEKTEDIDPAVAKFDLNGDGDVSVNDVMMLVNYILNH